MYIRSRETVFHVVHFSICMYACCRAFLVGYAYAFPLLPTLPRESQVWIAMDGIFHIQLKNKHSASSKHPINGILKALWWRCHPMDGKLKPHQALSKINLDCATGSTAVHNTTRVFE